MPYFRGQPSNFSSGESPHFPSVDALSVMWNGTELYYSVNGERIIALHMANNCTDAALSISVNSTMTSMELNITLDLFNSALNVSMEEISISQEPSKRSIEQTEYTVTVRSTNIGAVSSFLDDVDAITQLETDLSDMFPALSIGPITVAAPSSVTLEMDAPTSQPTNAPVNIPNNTTTIPPSEAPFSPTGFPMITEEPTSRLDTEAYAGIAVAGGSLILIIIMVIVLCCLRSKEDDDKVKEKIPKDDKRASKRMRSTQMENIEITGKVMSASDPRLVRPAYNDEYSDDDDDDTSSDIPTDSENSSSDFSVTRSFSETIERSSSSESSSGTVEVDTIETSERSNTFSTISDTMSGISSDSASGDLSDTSFSD